MLTSAGGCDLAVERGPDWLLVRLRNFDFLAPDAPPLAEQLWSLLQQHFTYRLVLELDDVRLNGPLIEQLAQLYRQIEEHDGVLRLCGLSPGSRQVLHASHLDDRLRPYEDRQEAVWGRPHLPRPR
jgi:anti-anti-sigma regulatory factor